MSKEKKKNKKKDAKEDKKGASKAVKKETAKKKDNAKKTAKKKETPKKTVKEQKSKKTEEKLDLAVLRHLTGGTHHHIVERKDVNAPKNEYIVSVGLTHSSKDGKRNLVEVGKDNKGKAVYIQRHATVDKRKKYSKKTVNITINPKMETEATKRINAKKEKKQIKNAGVPRH